LSIDGSGVARRADSLGDVARKVLAIAHRGASAITPENTKLAFVKALDLGADAIEFDVMLTRDEVPIVFHDETLDRTTNGSGRVNETDFATISELDAGSWFSASFKGVEVPTFEETLTTLGGKTLLNVELKPDERVEALNRRVVTAVARFELFSTVIFSSFQADALRSLRVLVPDARIGVLCEEGRLEGALALADELGAESLHPCVAMIDRELVEVAHARRLAVYAWTANTHGEIKLLTALGVDGMFTDHPDRVARPRR
jgi:glycerophosphoryl diester phosphodiesterase